MSTISTTFWNTMPILSSDAPGRVVPSDADLAKAPAAITADAFRSWTREKQLAYIDAHPGVTIGAVGAERITASVAAKPTAKTTIGTPPREIFEAGTVEPAPAADFDLAPGSLDPAKFLSWTKAEQQRYMEKNGKGTVGDSALSIGSSLSGKTTALATSVRDVAIKGSVLYDNGSATDIPYYNLVGSAAGTKSPFVMAKAEQLFPELNGTSATLSVADRPDGFNTDPATLTTNALAKPFLEKFATWHSAYQLEYVKAHGGTSGILVVPPGATEPLLTAIVSKSDPTKLYIVGSLDKAAFSRMSKEDQDLVVGTNAFANISSKLGLVGVTTAAVPSPTSTGTKVPATTAVTALVTYINGKTATNLSGAPLMPEAERRLFTSQLAILTEQLGTMGAVSPADISKKLTDLKDRFDRAFAFYDVKAATQGSVNMVHPDTNVPTFKDVVSTDDNATIKKGYQIFIAQEKRIAELAEARMQLVRDNGVLFGQNLDVPSLVFRFQSLYNLQLEAQVVMETEEINQQNALLKTYAAIQDAVNKTLAKFEKADSGKQNIFGLSQDDDYQNMTNEERKLLSMFEDVDGTGQKHPLEALRSIKRPTHDIFEQDSKDDGDIVDRYNLNDFSHLQWSAFGTRLSETVTIINQNSQIKMNDVNTMDKQRNRHFELANSALSKMSEMINNIARS